MNRRAFLKALSAAGISLPVLPGMAQTKAVNTEAQLPGHPRARHLILVEFAGGNDGLNTLVPFADPLYAKLRPRLALKPDNVLQLDETAGLHPSLEPLMRLWNRGNIALIQGVGYPAPNRSHFRSIEIWETASESNETLLNGWLTPIAATLPEREQSIIKALALAPDEGPLAGSGHETVVFTNLNDLVKQGKQLKKRQIDQADSALDHILSVEDTTRRAAESFAKTFGSANQQTQSTVKKNAPALVKQLDSIAQLIQADAGPQIYKVGLRGFDTHANQLNKHAGLMKHFSAAIDHLEKTLTKSGHWPDVLLMTYSEFGRRAAENGSAGTDHGTAAPHFLIGGSVKGGLYGTPPDLAGLTNNDVLFTTDFREIYSTISRNWFNQSLADTPYADFKPLPVLQSA